MIRAEPRYFGPADRPLFGWFHRARRDSALRTTSVLLCPPLGHESLGAHRSLRKLAERLADRGFTTLRMDYDGKGDSAGSSRDPRRWASWVASVRAGISAVAAESEQARVCVVGVRLGALVAEAAVRERPDVAGLVLIGPPASGREFLREAQAFRGAMERADPPPGFETPEGWFESAGLQLDPESIATIGAIEHGPQGLAPEVLLIERTDRPPLDAAVEKLAGAGAHVERERGEGIVEMLLDAHEAKVPEAVLTRVADWLDARFSAPTVAAAATSPSRTVAEVEPGVEEELAFLDQHRRVFGVVSRPVGAMPKRAMIILNSGAIHRIGAARGHVVLGRRLAAAGWVAVRLDVAGIGDSLPHAGADENDVYSSRVVEDVASAIDFLRTRYRVDQVELLGLCSGAYHAVRAAVYGLPIAGINVVNPLVFHWKPGMTLAYPAYQLIKAEAAYRRAVLDPRKWMRLLLGRLNLKAMSRIVRQRLADRARVIVRDVARSLRIPVVDDLRAELDAIVARGIRVRFIFSEGEPGEALLREGAGRGLVRMLRAGTVTIAHLPSCDHSLTVSWMHEALWRALFPTK